MIINANLGFHYHLRRQYEQAAKQLAATLAADPNFAHAHYNLGHLYFLHPTLGNAIPELERAVDLEPNSPIYIHLLGMSYARAGERNKALKILNDLEALSKIRYVSPIQKARLLFEMEGNIDEIMEALIRGYEGHDQNLPYLKAGEWWDPYRSDARFQALLRRMNFPEK